VLLGWALGHYLSSSGRIFTELMKKLIIIPAYNEAANLENLIREIDRLPSPYDYVIINDGSTDDTGEVCSRNGFNCVHLPINSGIGVAVQTGYKYARKYGYDLAIQIDGDGQHGVEYLDQVTAPIEAGECDVVIGSRFLEHKGFQSSFSRRTGIRFLSVLIYFCTGIQVKDVTSGYRAVNSKFIDIYSRDYSADYPEPEAIVTAVMHRGRIKEVPVQMRERQSGVSSINMGKSLYYMIKVTLAILIKRLSYGFRRG
jgi:hypothetical protein